VVRGFVSEADPNTIHLNEFIFRNVPDIASTTLLHELFHYLELRNLGVTNELLPSTIDKIIERAYAP